MNQFEIILSVLCCMSIAAWGASYDFKALPKNSRLWAIANTWGVIIWLVGHRYKNTYTDRCATFIQVTFVLIELERNQCRLVFYWMICCLLQQRKDTKSGSIITYIFHPILAYDLVACRILKGTNVVTILSRHSIYFIAYLECTILNI